MEMELRQALYNLGRIKDAVPEEEILCIREYKEEAIPALLEHLESGLKAIHENTELMSEEKTDNVPYSAMHLLAEFRANEAFPSMLKYLQANSDAVHSSMGLYLPLDFDRILASVATLQDIPALKAVVEDTTLDTQQRLFALDAMLIMVLEGVYEKREYYTYLRHIIENFQEDQGFLALMVSISMDVYASEHFEYINKLFDDDLIDQEVFSFEEFEEMVRESSEKEAFQKLKEKPFKSFVNDALTQITEKEQLRQKLKLLFSDAQYDDEWDEDDMIDDWESDWDDEDDEVWIPPKPKKTGRNEPCPCASGKKYKKCCGGNL